MKKNIFVLIAILFLVFFNSKVVVAENRRITGIVFFDENKNGIFDSNEKGIKNVYIKLYDSNGNRLRDRTTFEALSYNTDDLGKFDIEVNDDVKTVVIRKPSEYKSFIFNSKEILGNEFEYNVTEEKIILGLCSNTGYKVIENDYDSSVIEFEPIWTTLKTSVTAIIFTFIIGLLLVRLVRTIKIRWIRILIDAIFTLPLVLPPTVIGYFLLKILGVNSFIGKLFLNVFDFRIVFSWESTVIAAVILSLPMMYRSTLGVFEQIDENLIFAAKTLGFSERKIFWRVIVPNSIPGIASATILSFARGMGEYGATSMIAGNILGETRTIPVAVAVSTSAGQDEQATLYVLIIFVMAMVLISIMNIITYKISKKGVSKI